MWEKGEQGAQKHGGGRIEEGLIGCSGGRLYGLSSRGVGGGCRGGERKVKNGKVEKERDETGALMDNLKDPVGIVGGGERKNGC